MDRAIDFASGFYTKCLSSQFCLESLTYLNNRGISKEQAQEWRIGASLPSKTLLANAFLRKGLSLEDAMDSNLIVKKDDILEDRMFGRIPITLFSEYGVPVSLCGRAVDSNLFPKYLFLPNSAIFSKDKLLYGLDKAYYSIFKAGFAVVTEGFFDVLSAHAIGMHNTVAICGVTISSAQISKLYRWTRNVVLALDSDRAGIENSMKNKEKLESRGFTVSVCEFPEGEDLDSFIRSEGRDATRSLVSKAVAKV